MQISTKFMPYCLTPRIVALKPLSTNQDAIRRELISRPAPFLKPHAEAFARRVKRIDLREMRKGDVSISASLTAELVKRLGKESHGVISILQYRQNLKLAASTKKLDKQNADILFIPVRTNSESKKIVSSILPINEREAKRGKRVANKFPLNTEQCKKECDSYTERAKESAEQAEDELSDVMGYWNSANSFLVTACNSRDPVIKRANAVQALSILAHPALAQNNTAADYWVNQARRAASAASGLVERNCHCDIDAINGYLLRAEQAQTTIRNLLDSGATLWVAAAAAQYEQQANLEMANRAAIQNTLSSFESCIQVEERWFGLDVILSQDCTNELLNFLNQFCGSIQAEEFADILTDLIRGRIISAIGGLLGSAAAYFLGEIVTVAIQTECLMLKQAITNENSNGIRIHFSAMPIGLSTLQGMPPELLFALVNSTMQLQALGIDLGNVVTCVAYIDGND